jgi:glc operon protein GlcG
MNLRIVRLGLTVVGAIALDGAAFAQNVPEQFVVSGKAAEKIQDFTTINLATAQRIADSCEKAAGAENVQISIMVLDKEGNHVYMDRMDGQGYLNIVSADMKARTCRDWAASKGGTMSMYIIDNAGEFVHMERMDGQIYTNIHTALLKAQTALKTRQPTSIRTAQLKNDPGGIPRQLAFFDFFTNSGGIPIVVDGQMIGAVGVGGGAGGGDENCAIEGLKATFGDHVTLPVYPAAAAAGR